MNHDYQIDLSQYYGLSGASRETRTDFKKTTQKIPSLEQIARYNTEQQGLLPSEPYPPYMQHCSGASCGPTGISSEESKTPQMASPNNTAQQLPHQSYPLTEEGNEMFDGSTAGLSPIQEYNQPFPITAESIQYLNGFLRSQIGRRVMIEFLVGNNCLVTRDGFLLAVGANFILINPTDTDDLMACDFFNIKFIKIYY